MLLGCPLPLPLPRPGALTVRFEAISLLGFLRSRLGCYEVSCSSHLPACLLLYVLGLCRILSLFRFPWFVLLGWFLFFLSTGSVIEERSGGL